MRLIFSILLQCIVIFSYTPILVANIFLLSVGNDTVTEYENRNYLNVGTYNLKGVGDPEEVARDLSQLGYIDIWGFQEINSKYKNKLQPSPLPAIFSKILPSGTWYTYFIPFKEKPIRQRVVEGLAIVSRFPIIHADWIYLEHSEKKTRIALLTWIDISDEIKLVFVNTDHEMTVPFSSFKERKSQMLFLLNYLSKYKDQQIIIVGDFNTAGNLITNKSMRKEIYLTNTLMKENDFYPLSNIPHDAFSFRVSVKKYLLDHIFLHNIHVPAAWYSLPNAEGSDHIPIWTKIPLTP